MLKTLVPLCAVAAFPKLVLFAGAPPPTFEPDNTSANSLTVEQIVERLDEKNRERAAALRRFEGRRTYRMQYQGFFGAREAEMVVAVKSSSDERQFTVESQCGSKFITDHIFSKLIDGEKESLSEEHRRRTALNSDNYDFSFASAEGGDDPSLYALNVTPKTDEKFLYRGRIWVDAADFAVVRIAAAPAKSPSVWVKKTEINHRYEKVESFWLPAENRTESFIRFGGRALLSIEYNDYKIVEANAAALT
jgi:hypothetical protein